MADATVEAYTEVVDEAVDVNVAVAAAEEEVRTLGFRSIVATGFQISDYWILNLALAFWLWANFS